LFDVKSGNNASTRDLVSGSVLGDILQQKVFEVPHGQSQLMADHADTKQAELFHTGNLWHLLKRPPSVMSASTVYTGWLRRIEGAASKNHG